MKITFTAENDAEKKILGKDSTEIENVQEYALVGAHTVDLVSRVRFHVWNGSPDFLIGRMYRVLKLLEYEDRHPIEYEDRHPKKSMIVGVGGEDAGS
jgi:hypothetical protein